MTREYKVLKNGVKFYPLVQNHDYQLADSFLAEADATENYESKEVFTKRIDKVDHLIGTYEIIVERQRDYIRFIRRLKEETNHKEIEFSESYYVIRDMFYSNRISRQNADTAINALRDIKDSECECKLCSFTDISFEEWKNGKLMNGRRLGKEMKKAGFSQALIDFYSAQVKTEKSVYFTVSNLVQHIAGMSRLAELGSWNQWNGTSCQDTRHNSDLCEHLIGSLHDEKLFVGMLHDSLDDLEDMQDKLKARTVLRYFSVSGHDTLLSARYYGNNETQSLLHNALLKLECIGIFSEEYRNGSWSDRIKVQESYETFSSYKSIDIHIYIDDEYDIVTECPVCNWNGEIEVNDEYENSHYITCPVCRGTNQYETTVYIEVDEWETIEDYVNIKPYEEIFDYYSNYVKIGVNVKYVKEKLEA